MIYNKEGRRVEAGDVYDALLTIYETSDMESLISDICNHFSTDDIERFIEGTADPDNFYDTYLTEDDLQEEE